MTRSGSSTNPSPAGRSLRTGSMNAAPFFETSREDPDPQNADHVRCHRSACPDCPVHAGCGLHERRDEPGGYAFPGAFRCTTPGLTGTGINVTASDMGCTMMGGSGMMRGSMLLTAERAAVASGEGSFLVTNVGTIPDEMMIVLLAGTQIAGTHPVGRDGKIDVSGSLAEAAATCAEGEGNGVLPSAAGWITLTLRPDDVNCSAICQATTRPGCTRGSPSREPAGPDPAWLPASESCDVNGIHHSRLLDPAEGRSGKAWAGFVPGERHRNDRRGPMPGVTVA
ncbi:hypothetical protein ABIB49_003050 [Arthrobacter sp. UYCu512]